MKFSVHISALFILCLSVTTFGQQAKLEGRVLNDKESRVANVRIVAPGAQAAETDSKGHFAIAFPSSIQPGQATHISVGKVGWVIIQPLMGNCVTQSAERNYDPLQVIIVPRSSQLALSPKMLSQVIAKWADERVRLRAEVGSLKQNLDEYAFLRRYAKQYGFTLEQLRDAAQQWAQIKDSDDKEERALKEYWQKNYVAAAQLAQESALEADEELKQANKKTNEASLKVIRRYQLAGNSFYAEYKFREALAAFKEIEKRFETKELSKENFIAEWAGMEILIGDAKAALGIRVEGEEGPRSLKEALGHIQQSATFYTREQSPQDWAATQNDLGIVLWSLGQRVSGAASIKYLNEAVAAYHGAIEVRTREQLPQDWSATQNNLGLTLMALGERGSGAASIKYLNEAVAALRAVLEPNIREQFPYEWGMAQTNLGPALVRMGERTEGAESVKYLNDAVAASRVALEVRTREQSPQEWAVIQSNLAMGLMRLGEQADGAESVKYLNDAVAASRAALEVRTRAELPQDWAMTESNLAVTLIMLAAQVSGAESVKYLNEAVAALRATLEVRTREQLPQDWAATQINLATAYQQLRDWSSAEEAAASVLTLDPNNKDAYRIVHSLYHEILFKFDKALALNQQWLARHPEDISAQANFAEAYFTIGGFAESAQRINALLANQAVPPRTRIALRAIEIADLLALGQIQQVPAKVDALIAEVAGQPVDFKVLWRFDGTRHFIGQDEKLSSYRAWLGQLFDALASKDRDTMLKALQDVRAKFKP